MDLQKQSCGGRAMPILNTIAWAMVSGGEPCRPARQPCQPFLFCFAAFLCRRDCPLNRIRRESVCPLLHVAVNLARIYEASIVCGTSPALSTPRRCKLTPDVSQRFELVGLAIVQASHGSCCLMYGFRRSWLQPFREKSRFGGSESTKPPRDEQIRFPPDWSP